MAVIYLYIYIKSLKAIIIKVVVSYLSLSCLTSSLSSSNLRTSPSFLHKTESTKTKTKTKTKNSEMLMC